MTAAAQVLDADVAAERVAAGIELLQEFDVDLKSLSKRTLDIEKFDQCVGAQLKKVDLFIDVLGCNAAKGVECGFDLAHDEATSENYQTLTDAWKKAL